MLGENFVFANAVKCECKYATAHLAPCDHVPGAAVFEDRVWFDAALQRELSGAGGEVGHFYDIAAIASAVEIDEQFARDWCDAAGFEADHSREIGEFNFVPVGQAIADFLNCAFQQGFESRATIFGEHVFAECKCEKFAFR